MTFSVVGQLPAGQCSGIKLMMNSWRALLFFAPLDADLLAQRHQIEIHPSAFPAASEKIKWCIVLYMS